jgi:hypothetical protein
MYVVASLIWRGYLMIYSSQLDEPEEEKEEKKSKDPTGIADDKLLKMKGQGKAGGSAKGKGKRK